MTGQTRLDKKHYITANYNTLYGLTNEIQLQHVAGDIELFEKIFHLERHVKCDPFMSSPVVNINSIY